jgi:flagellar biosynthesis/type III secretory pathway protein FliH
MTSWLASPFYQKAPIVASTAAWTPRDLAFRPTKVVAAEPEITPEDRIAEGYALGFEEGRLEGERGEQARLASAVRAIRDAMESIAIGEERWTSAIEENIAALATVIARHVIEREISSDATIVTKLVRRALSEFPVEQAVRVRLNPHDVIVIESLSESGMDAAMDEPSRAVAWIGDSRIEPGGCVVEGRERIVDGRIDTALERAYRRLSRSNA